MTMLLDLRYAIRSLRRAPLVTAAAVVSLVLGIATCTMVFSLVSAAMLRPPPFEDADRLSVLYMTERTPAEGVFRLRWSWSRFKLLEGSVQSFESVGSSYDAVLTITGVNDPEPLPVEMVSASYLHVMRAPLVLGSGFAPGHDVPGRESGSVVLGHGLWRRRFGGAPDVLGRVIELNGVPVTVVGVAGPGFSGASGVAQAWIPATVAPRAYYPDYLTTNQNFLTVVGRLRRGVTLDAAKAELRVLGARIHAEEPSDPETPEDRFSATATTLNDARVDPVTRRALLLLQGAVGVLLLISCTNVASLMLGRAVLRRKEIAIRLALGARRSTLVRQLLVESGVIAILSGLLGLGIVAWGIDILRIPPALARGSNFWGAVSEFSTATLDWRVVAFTFAVCACAALLFGLVPALRSTRTDLVNDLKAGGGHVTRGSRQLGLRELAVAGQVALAMVLIVGCGLLLTSYARLRDTPLGFDPDHLLTFTIQPSDVKYTPARAPALLDAVLGQIRRVPGVEAATVDGCAPLSTRCARAELHIVGRPWSEPTDAPTVVRHYVAPAHFKTLRVPVLRGRGLSESDRAGRPPIVVINEAAAERFWPNEDPIGKRVWFDTGDTAAAFASPESSAEIVGVVGNVAYQPLDEQPNQPGFFTAYAQFTRAKRMVLVRTRGEPLTLAEQIARAVRRADPDLALFDVQTMASRAQLSWSKLAFQTTFFVVIGLIALSLAVTGVYAVTSGFVSSRMRDIGMRMALGANTLHVARAAAAQTVRLGLVGGAVGLLGAVALSRVLRATLYETSPLDPRVFAAGCLVLTAAFAVASYVPVRRALRLNPVEVLRNE